MIGRFQERAIGTPSSQTNRIPHIGYDECADLKESYCAGLSRASFRETVSLTFAFARVTEPLSVLKHGRDDMAGKIWSEPANRRLRALLLKRRPIAEIALFLECTADEVRSQMRRLGIVRSPRSTSAA